MRQLAFWGSALMLMFAGVGIAGEGEDGVSRLWKTSLVGLDGRQFEPTLGEGKKAWVIFYLNLMNQEECQASFSELAHFASIQEAFPQVQFLLVSNGEGALLQQIKKVYQAPGDLVLDPKKAVLHYYGFSRESKILILGPTFDLVSLLPLNTGKEVVRVRQYHEILNAHF